MSRELAGAEHPDSKSRSWVGMGARGGVRCLGSWEAGAGRLVHVCIRDLGVNQGTHALLPSL